ncbi:hypothetical protein MC885_015631 [Smutsia gigantea]|nr:hypothetical protein MC885_015631 [Smutsia gigantea]
MSSDFPHYNFRMPNIGFQNLPLNIYIVVFGTAIFVFILSLLFCCYLIRLRHQAHKEFYAYKQVILKEKVKELNLHELCAVCLEDFKPRDELGICPCKHAFHRKCLIKWLEVRKVCPLCNMPVLQLAQLHSKQDRGPPQGPLPGAEHIDQTAAGADIRAEQEYELSLCWLRCLGHQLPLPLPHEELLGQLSWEPRLLGLVTTRAR